MPRWLCPMLWVALPVVALSAVTMPPAAPILAPPAPAAGATETSVMDHLRVISWFSGTFACTSKVTYSNGKTEIASWTVETSKPENGWMHSAEKEGIGMDYYGYDPRKGEYVTLGTGGPGDYAASYFTVGKDQSMSLAFNNEFSETSSYSGVTKKLTPTANGSSIVESGPTHIHPGLRYKESGMCVRQ